MPPIYATLYPRRFCTWIGIASRGLLLLALLLLALMVFALGDASGVQAQTEPAALPDIAIDFHVIGFATDDATTAQLEEIADAAGGAYYSADDQQDLEEAFSRGMGVSGTPAVVSAEVEPNDSFGKANAIAPTGSVNGAISPENDEDWYMLEAQHRGELLVTITNVPEDLDIHFRVWNAEVNVQAGWYNPMAQGGDTEAVVDLPAPGRYRLQVEDRDNDAASVEPYTLRTVFTPAPDVFEPNPSLGAAAPIDLNTTLRANILPQRDEDWYSFQVDHHGELQVTISEVPEEMALTFRIWDAEGNVYAGWFNPLAPGGNTEAVIDLPAPGTYYMQLHESDDDHRAIDPYALTTVFTPAPDMSEPNGSFGTATEIEPDTTLQANILPRRDEDWYCVTVDHHGELAVTISDVATDMAITFRVWDADIDVMAGWYNPLSAGSDTSAMVDLPAPGRYCLQVKEDGDDARSIQPYTLQTVFTPAVDAYEPNDSIGAAYAINPSSELQANILPRRDEDWYTFRVDHHGELRITSTDVPENLDVQYRVWDADGDVLAGWFTPLAVGGDTEAVVDLPAPGRYTLQVIDGGDDARAIEPYTLHTIYNPAPDSFEPNGSYSRAASLTLGTPVEGNILPRRDVDLYAVEVDAPGELRINVTNVAPELDINVRVRNADERVVAGWFAPLAAGGDTDGTAAVEAAGLYYIEVVDGGGDARSLQPYVLTVELAPGGAD